MADEELSKVMAQGSGAARERRLAHVDRNGVVRQISHVVGMAALRPEALLPPDPSETVLDISEDEYRAIRDDADADKPRGTRLDSAQRKFLRRPEWAPAGMPPVTLTIGSRTEIRRLRAPATVTLSWDGLPALRVEMNGEDHEIDSPFTLEMREPGQYELAVTDARAANDRFLFVIDRPGKAGGSSG